MGCADSKLKILMATFCFSGGPGLSNPYWAKMIRCDNFANNLHRNRPQKYTVLRVRINELTENPYWHHIYILLSI